MASKFTKIGTTLALGLGTFTAGVLSSATVSSLITKGDLVFDTATNTTPAIVVNSTDVATFSTTAIEVPVTLSGATVTAGGGTVVLNTGLVEAATISGSTIKAVTTRGTQTLSGSSLTVSGVAAGFSTTGSGSAVCVKVNGTLGYCTKGVSATGICGCN